MKQVIVVNQSLNLPPGKLAVQVAHAAVAALLRADPAAQSAWLRDGMPKVVLAIDDEAALLELAAASQRHSLPTAQIRDAGRTVVAAGTLTCVGIGPAAVDAIDALAGRLKLLR